MTVAASATVVSGATVTSASLITSRTVAMAALPPTEPSPPAAARKALLAWYRPRRAAYPWRAGPKDPYRVLVSEVMAQQDTGPARRARVRTVHRAVPHGGLARGIFTSRR